MQAVRIWENVSRQQFEAEIRPLNQPALLKGLVMDWPATRLARQSDDALVEYIKACDNGNPAEALIAAPDMKGEFFYGEELNTRNFLRGKVTVAQALTRLMDQKSLERPHAVYIQSTPIADHLPRFGTDNVLDLLPLEVLPRIWIGNALRVQTHYDLSDNIACLVAGRRRFTVFPPDQLGNLYPGPMDNTLSGTPVSMVSLENPDFHMYPRFREALEMAQVADLEPGDALYLPFFWWHHVRSFEPFNVLVNYWWKEMPEGLGMPHAVLLHGLLTLRDLPAPQREAWKHMLDYYVFGSHGDPVAHLKPQDRSIFGAMTPEMAADVKQQLIAGMMADWNIKP
jgi:hypothetical protein